jgi:chromosome segregation ATPase
MTNTRARTKAQAPAENPEDANQKSEPCELRTLRDEIGILRSKAAAAEERAFYTASTVKELQQAFKEAQENVRQLAENMADLRARLREVENGHRKVEDSLRSKTRDTIEQIKNHVVRQQDLERSAVNVGRVLAMKAESMVSDIDDARSEVSTSDAASSVAPRYVRTTGRAPPRSASPTALSEPSRG